MDIWIIEGRYEVQQQIARWPLVEIYLARDTSTGEQVRVKRFSPRLAEDMAFVEGWRDQLQAVQALDLPCVQPVLAFGDLAGEGLYQVESLPTGVRLSTWWRQIDQTDIDRAVDLVEMLARALGDVHEAGVSHGALYPGNIYLTESPEGEMVPLFTDWELRELGEAGLLPTAVARYLAPEEPISPEHVHTPASDVYALGYILYELLTGENPYARPADDPLTRRHVPVVPPSRYNPAISPALERVVLLALDPNPSRRPPHGHALARALQRARSESALENQAPPVPLQLEERVAPVPTPSSTGPNVALAAIAGVLVLFAVVLLAVVWQVARRPEPPPPVGVVPNLVGLPLDEAERIVRVQGLSLQVVGTRLATGPTEVVLEQTPMPGGLVPDDRTVRVVVSGRATPTTLVPVPDVFSLPVDRARLVLEEAGLRLGTVRQAHDAAVPAGLVLEQNPRAGVAVAAGTAVDLIVSAGPPP